MYQEEKKASVHPVHLSWNKKSFLPTSELDPVSALSKSLLYVVDNSDGMSSVENHVYK